MRMIVFHALGHVYYIDLVFKQPLRINRLFNFNKKNSMSIYNRLGLQNVKLAEIGVNEFGNIKKSVNNSKTVQVQLSGE